MPTGGNEAEWLTRKKRIDTKLGSLDPAWQIIPWQENLDTSKLACHAVTEFPTGNGPADYALFVNGVLLGIIEAKKVAVSPQNVLEQAKRYARGVENGPGNWNGFRIPFLYATNGEIIWHLDVRSEKPVSRTISNFHTATGLEEKFAIDDSRARKWLLDTPPERITRLRPYQAGAIVATEIRMTTRMNSLQTAIANAEGGGTLQTSEKNAALQFALDGLDAIAFYVQTAARYDLPMFLTSGFQTVSANHGQSPLDTPSVTGIDNDISTQLDVHVSPITNAAGYEVQTSTGTSGWQTVKFSTQARTITLTGLATGSTVQVRALGGSTGQSDWSAPSSSIVD